MWKKRRTSVCGFKSEAEWGSNQACVSLLYKTRHTHCSVFCRGGNLCSWHNIISPWDRKIYLFNLVMGGECLYVYLCLIWRGNSADAVATETVFMLRGNSTTSMKFICRVCLWLCLHGCVQSNWLVEIASSRAICQCQIGWGREVTKIWRCRMEKKGEFRSDPCRRSCHQLEAALLRYC